MERRTVVETPFGRLVANPSNDDEMPGICVSIEDGGTGMHYERPLAVVEAVERDSGGTALRLVAWESDDFESYKEYLTFLESDEPMRVKEFTDGVNKALCGGSEVYRALGEAQKALEVQEEQHRKELEALRAENIHWRQITTEQDKQIDWLRSMVHGDCDYCAHHYELHSEGPCGKCVHYDAEEFIKGDYWVLKGDTMDRTKAADIIRERIAIDKATMSGEPVSDFDKFVAEQDEALDVAVEALESPLLSFIKDEVPFRLREILDVSEEQITPELIDMCVNYLHDNSDVMFNYDAIDDSLRTIVTNMEGTDDDN